MNFKYLISFVLTLKGLIFLIVILLLLILFISSVLVNEKKQQKYPETRNTIPMIQFYLKHALNAVKQGKIDKCIVLLGYAEKKIKNEELKAICDSFIKRLKYIREEGISTKEFIEDLEEFVKMIENKKTLYTG